MRSARLRPLSTNQMMKGVAYCAVAFAGVAPLVQIWQAGAVQGGAWEGMISIAIFGCVGVPLAWAGLTFVLVRREDGRDGLILALLLVSIVVAEGTACYFLAWVIAWWLRRRGPVDLSALALIGTVAVVLGASLWFVARRLGRSLRSGRALGDADRARVGDPR